MASAADRFDSLVAGLAGEPGVTPPQPGTAFGSGKGKAMKEWLAVDADRGGRWEELAREALEFVQGG